MKTSEIFKRAKQIADLEGTSFISWNESINLINENYITLYQKLIDMGDSAFVRDFKVPSGVYALPSDFWQLKGVFISNNGKLYTVERRAANGSFNSTCYEIKNNVLHIYGTSDSVLVQYFPKPKKLTYKPNDIPLSDLAGIKNDILACNDKVYLYSKLEEDNKYSLNLYDLSGLKTKEKIIEYEHGELNIEKCWLTDGYIVIKTDSSLAVINIYSYNMNALENTDSISYTPLFTESGDLFIVSKTDEATKINMLELTDGGYSLTEVREISYDGDEYYSDNFLEDIFYIKSNVIKHNGAVIENFTADRFAYKDKELYFLRFGAYGKINIENDVLIIDMAPGRIIDFNKLDSETGYGYSSLLFGANIFVRPFVEDTELDYPNSFFFQLLSYMIAIAMKIKQGADATGIQAQLSSMEMTFFDTLGSDAFQSTRITNCY
ncbi:MAG: hypothetical protein MJ174_07460 [Treponema sp.]|nr:hypothetical protein [Treponema sp.]